MQGDKFVSRFQGEKLLVKVFGVTFHPLQQVALEPTSGPLTEDWTALWSQTAPDGAAYALSKRVYLARDSAASIIG